MSSVGHLNSTDTSGRGSPPGPASQEEHGAIFSEEIWEKNKRGELATAGKYKIMQSFSAQPTISIHKYFIVLTTIHPWTESRDQADRVPELLTSF